MARRADGLALLIVCVEVAIIGLDLTIVNVALPDVHRALRFSADGLAWVVDAYALTWGGLILLGGRLADLAGRKAILIAGVCLFVAASAAGGLARTQEMLIAARLFQGAGAALASPAALALVTALVPPQMTSRAVAIWTAAAGVGGTIGQLAGGVIITELGWRWVFLVNVPVGVVLVAATWLAVPAVARSSPRPRLDLSGTVLSTLAILALIYGVLRAGVNGWGNHRVLAALFLAGLLLAAFTTRELLTPAPLVPRWLVASRTRVTSYLTGLLLYAWMYPFLFIMTQYCQDVRGWSPLRTGLYLLPTGAGTIVGALIARRLAGRVPAWLVVVTGGIGLLYGSVRLARLTAFSGYPQGLLPALAVSGVCVGLVLAGNTPRAVEDAGQEPGLASGLLQTSQQLGASVAVAALAVVASAAATRYLSQWASAHHAIPAVTVEAQAATHGYTTALSITIIIAIAVIAVQPLALGRRRPAVTRATPRRDASSPDPAHPATKPG